MPITDGTCDVPMAKSSCVLKDEKMYPTMYVYVGTSSCGPAERIDAHPVSDYSPYKYPDVTSCPDEPHPPQD